jgi:uncharacterized protein
MPMRRFFQISHHRDRRCGVALVAFSSRCQFTSSLATTFVAMAKKKNGIMMILSPAKTLDLSPLDPVLLGDLAPTEPDCNPAGSRQVAHAMKSRSEGELQSLLGLSKNLAKTAAGYWNDFSVDNPGSMCRMDDDDCRVKPCIFAFSGAAYQGLRIKECDAKALAYMQDFLRIIDPTYGLLRPLDVIQPYRLEMAARGVLDDKNAKLSAFWSDSVTKRLSEELKCFADPILVNVASDEYIAAVDIPCLPENVRYIKVVFWENGKVVSVHAKRARGLMVRYMAQGRACSVNDVKNFAEEGYTFQGSKSNETMFVFDRPKQQPAKRTTSASQNKGTKKTKIE